MFIPMDHILKKYLLLAIIFVLVVGFITPEATIQAQSGLCQAGFQSVGTPLTELGKQTYTRMDGQQTSFTGGLYPDGSNLRPEKHETAGINLAKSITPLDMNGDPDPNNGRIVMISIGMSNVNAEFDTFSKMVQGQDFINPHLVLVNGALGGQTADKWVDPKAIAWQELTNTLNRYEISPQQVQVAWIKQTLTRGGDFPASAQELQNDLIAIVQNLKTQYPNVKIAYLSSRIYSYTYFRGLSPEPNAYETGFAVKWLIEQQINGDPELNYDPQLGEVQAPYLSWGPYLWADGQNPRADGLVWEQEDLTDDCTHPSESGQQKVAEQLLAFFRNDTTSKSWFLRPGENSQPLPVDTATQTPGVTTQAVEEIAPTATRAEQQTPTTTPTVKSAVDDQNQMVEDTASSFWQRLIEWIRQLFSGN